MSEQNVLPPAPNSWRWIRHREIADINPKLPEYLDVHDDTVVSFVPMAAVEPTSGAVQLTQTRKYGDVKKGYTSFIDGDLLFAKITPCMENGKIAVVQGLTNGIGCGSTEFHVSRPIDGVNPRYLFYYFVRATFRRDAQRSMTGSAGQLRVPKTYFENVLIPLPPSEEQERIVGTIDELFSQLDNAVESLKSVHQQLKLYRQIVLQWAFDGRLTANWREEKKQACNLETGTDFLKRVLGQTKIPFQVDTVLPAELLPSEWCWVRLGTVTNVSGGIAKHHNRENLAIKLPYLRVANVYSNSLDLGTVLKIGVKDDEIDKTLLQTGDLLVVEGNGSIEQIGRVAIWNGEIAPCIHQNHIIKARPHSMINAKFLLYFLISERGREFIRREAASTSGLYTLSLSKVRNFPVPWPGAEEQTRIIEEVERRWSICDQLEATLDAQLKSADSLRESILRHAFSGNLILQNPNDEPVSKITAKLENGGGRKKPVSSRRAKHDAALSTH